MIERKPLEIGTKYGSLTVLASADPILCGKLRPRYSVRCDCGRVKVSMKQHILLGQTCGLCTRSASQKAAWEKRNPKNLCQRMDCEEPRFKVKLCVKHYRFHNMRSRAISSRKYAPSYAELEAMVPADMNCPVCGLAMRWYAGVVVGALISLQHDRDGKCRMICFSCNARHLHFSGDTYYEFQTPKDKKRCARCKATLPMKSFVSKRRGGYGEVGSYCKPCHNLNGKEYKARFPEKFKSWHRDGEKRRRRAREVERMFSFVTGVVGPLSKVKF